MGGSKLSKIYNNIKQKLQNNLKSVFYDENERSNLKDMRTIRNLSLLVMLLTISLTCLYVNKSMSYSKYERVEFESAGSILFANLYYPAKSYEFQDTRPLIIYCHGIGLQRDFDLRIPIEFTKRGFYVAALDYQGHGESGGNIANIDQSTGTLAIAQDCSKLLDKLESFPFFNDVNPDQIGLIGHSFGGMVVLMNQALDARFNVTVAWAPLTNFEPQMLGLPDKEAFTKFIPVNLLNQDNTHNLLVIMHLEDEVLDFHDQTAILQEKTSCEVLSIEEILFLGGHQLLSDRVIIESINWFELYFFKSIEINGPIQITYMHTYGFIITSLTLIFGIVLILISYSSKFFISRKRSLEYDTVSNSEPVEKSVVLKRVTKMFFYSGIFIINWMAFELLLGILGILFASLNALLFFFITKLIRYFYLEGHKFQWVNIKRELKKHFKLKYIIYSFICSIYFICIYLIFSFFCPFGFVWPTSMMSILMTIVAFPIYISMEILYRLVIYPLLDFMKSERKKSLTIIGIAILIHMILISITWNWSFLPSTILMYIILLVVAIQNTLIYEHTHAFGIVILGPFDIIQLFLGGVISNLLGIYSTLHLFV